MNWNDKIYPCITTGPTQSWQHKIWECDRLNVKEIGVFPTLLTIRERKKLYAALKKSKVERIPLVHIRDDFRKWEFEFFSEKYSTKHFNFHEHSFDDLYKWPSWTKKIYLEYNKDNRISKLVQINKIGGLCIDLAHLWAAKYKQTKEFTRANKDLRNSRVGCNHLNGYSYKFKRDLHYIRNKKQLDYLKEVPKKYFSNIIILEMQNSIVEQLKFKKYIVKILSKK